MYNTFLLKTFLTYDELKTILEVGKNSCTNSGLETGQSTATVRVELTSLKISRKCFSKTHRSSVCPVECNENMMGLVHRRPSVTATWKIVNLRSWREYFTLTQRDKRCR